MSKRHLVAGALTAALLASAIPGLALAQEAGAEATPEGVQWNLTTLAGSAVPDGVEAGLLLEAGEAVGSAGCNSFFGRYELDGEALAFTGPFGVTQRLCESPAQDVEDAYLPLLEQTAAWSIDDEGALSLADADGMVQLVYTEAPVDITGSDVDALVAALGELQSQIDQASAEVAALAAETASIPVNKFNKRLTAVEKEVKKLDDRTKGLNVESLKKRISALESQVETLNKTVDRFRDRIKVLEESDQDQDRRLKDLEDAVFVPTPME